MKKIHIISSLLILFLISSCGSSKNTVKADPYIGSWSLLIEDTPQGDVNAKMAISKNEDGEYQGSLSSDMGTFKLEDFKIESGSLSSTFEVQEMEFDLTGSFEDTKFKGFVSGMGADFKANGEKIVSE